MRYGSAVLGMAIVLLLASPLATSQTYPGKPMRLVAPYAPGGSSAAAALAYSQKMHELMGQPMVIEYRPGAGSNVGSESVAKAAPDGYTLLMGTSSLAINPNLYRNMTFDPMRDLAAIAVLFRAPNVLAVNPSLPIHSVKELIDYARANPGKLNYGSSGNGATNHMAMELFKYLAKVDIVHIAYKGGGEAMPALVGGQIQVMFSPASTLAPQDKAGRVRMLAVSSARRIDGINLPTIAASGLPGFESQVWFGLFAPTGTPAPIIGRLNAESNRALKDKQVLAVLEKAELEGVGGTAEDMHRLRAEDFERWAGVVKATGIRIE